MALLVYLCLQELTLLAYAVIWQNPISGPGLGLRERRGESLQSLLFDFSRVDPVLVRCTAPEWCAAGLVSDDGCVEGNRGPGLTFLIRRPALVLYTPAQRTPIA